MSSSQNTCSTCGGTGYFLLDVRPGHPDFGRAQPCLCQRAARLRRMKRALVEVQSLETDMLLMGFDTFDRRHFPDVLAACEAFAARPNDWIVLVGPNGTGKTHLLAAIYQAVRAAPDMGLPLYTVTPRLLDWLRAGYDPESGRDGRRRVELLELVPVLLLDDLGAQNETGWVDEQLFRVLDARYVGRRPTVIASNLRFADWPPRLASRAQDHARSQVFRMIGDDYRLRPVAERQIPMSNGHPQTRGVTRGPRHGR